MPKDSSFNSFSFTYITNNSNMIIDFNNIKEQALQNFKGGNGELDTRNYVDDKCKIMLSHHKPGANSGYHKHEGNCEIVYIISGQGYFNYDGNTERVKAGDTHYCPINHSHAMYNDGTEDLVYLSIVPEHH